MLKRSFIPLLPNLLKSRLFSTNSRVDMRFVQFVSTKDTKSTQKLGVQLKTGDILDLNYSGSPLPSTLIDYLHFDNGGISLAEQIVEKCENIIPLNDVRLLAPVLKPDKILCLGLNYSGHILEQNIKPPNDMIIFNKFPSTIVGPYDNVTLPKHSQQVDFEVEMAIVIGRKVKHLTRDNAIDCIFGFTCAQDISARDWQKNRNGKQWLLGKSMDSFCPLGPAVVTADELDPRQLKISCKVNGETKQNANTNELIFKIEDILVHITSICTLYPGDIILTGTPAGVGLFRNPPEFLKSGDIIESEIQGIGSMKNICTLEK